LKQSILSSEEVSLVDSMISSQATYSRSRAAHPSTLELAAMWNLREAMVKPPDAGDCRETSSYLTSGVIAGLGAMTLRSGNSGKPFLRSISIWRNMGLAMASF
jgi:hypothetical protein